MGWEKNRRSPSYACCFLCEYLPRGTEEITRIRSRDSRYHNRMEPEGTVFQSREKTLGPARSMSSLQNDNNVTDED
jgi:hypothetical protein